MKYLIDEQTLKDITNSVKDKTEETGSIKVSDLKGKIEGIPTAEDLDIELNAQDGLLNKQEQAIININTAIDNIKDNKEHKLKFEYLEEDEITGAKDVFKIYTTINGKQVSIGMIFYSSYIEQLVFDNTLYTPVDTIEDIYEIIRLLIDIGMLDYCSEFFWGRTELVEAKLFDTSKTKYMAYLFADCTNLEVVPLYDLSNVIDIAGMFMNCTSLTSIPQFNTQNVENMTEVFSGCTNLITLPLLDTHNTIYMVGLVDDCSNLSDESLNNILKMCADSNFLADEFNKKTLECVGLSEEQANKCKTLSNYSAFIEAGWTTGY